MPQIIQTPDGEVEFPDSMSDQEIAAVLDKEYGAKPLPPNREDPSVLSPRDWGDVAADALPAVGAMIGGMLGAVGGIPGAAVGATIGGAGGQGWRRVVEGIRGRSNPKIATTEDAVNDIMREGVTQGALEAGGGLVLRGLQKGAHRVYKGLLRPSQGLTDSFGDIAEVGLREGRTVSQAGAERAARDLTGSRDAAMQMVRQAKGAPAITEREIVSEYAPVVTELRKRADIGQRPELAAVGERGRRVVQAIRRGVDVERGQALKETAQDAASGAYRALERGTQKQLSADDLLDKATATGFRKAIETRVPGVAAQNARTQELLGLTRALEDAAERASKTGAVGARDVVALLAGGGAGTLLGGAPGGLAGAGLVRLLQAPRAGSLAAIGMDRLGRAPVGLDDLVRSLLVTQNPE